MNKEKAFISSIVYLYNDSSNIKEFYRKIYTQMLEHFDYFEIIFVDDCCSDKTVDYLRQECESAEFPISIVHMSRHQGREAAMNAGIDISIGDYIFQFENINDYLDEQLIFRAYEELQGCYDMVSVCPSKKKIKSRLFHYVINKGNNGNSKTGTELFSVVSRRAVNRVHAINEYMPYRKSAFATSGLEITKLDFNGKCNGDHSPDFSTAIESILLYTKHGYRFSVFASSLMLIIALIELVYIITVYFMGTPIEGWTTLALFITLGFSGLFIIMTIVIRYLALILNLTYKKQQYMVSSIEKIQK